MSMLTNRLLTGPQPTCKKAFALAPLAYGYLLLHVGETVKANGTSGTSGNAFAFEGSMATSKLQRQVSEFLSVHLGHYTIRENYRPEWLSTDNGGRLELDFYIEELRAAIEVQGIQHFEFSPMFHATYGDFIAQQERDRRKKELCASSGIELFEVVEMDEMPGVVEQLTDKVFEYEIHPNAAQMAESTSTLGGEKGPVMSYRCYINQETEYPPGFKRHIKRVFRILAACPSVAQLAPSNARRLRKHLAAIQNSVQDTSTEIERQERIIIRAAERAIELSGF